MDTQKDKLLAKAERLNVYRHGPVAYLKKSVTALLFENWVNVLMICFPLAIHMEENHGDPSNIFFCSLLAIAPFAERLSFVTEQLALHTSEVLGGMLNATFGNVTVRLPCQQPRSCRTCWRPGRRLSAGPAPTLPPRQPLPSADAPATPFTVRAPPSLPPRRRRS